MKKQLKAGFLWILLPIIVFTISFGIPYKFLFASVTYSRTPLLVTSPVTLDFSTDSYVPDVTTDTGENGDYWTMVIGNDREGYYYYGTSCVASTTLSQTDQIEVPLGTVVDFVGTGVGPAIDNCTVNIGANVEGNGTYTIFTIGGITGVESDVLFNGILLLLLSTAFVAWYFRKA